MIFLSTRDSCILYELKLRLKSRISLKAEINLRTAPRPLRVSLPQNETIWTAYDTPADLVRLLLGLGVCAWLAYQLFQVPHDAGSSRTWFYLGLVAVPFALITLFAVW